MINVNQITAQLARMPDQALQQFAAMHKSDPYTVSLALSESNRRKQMRTAAQMPQGEQPKVVDQQVAEMVAPQAPAQAMPEDTGIGALPAGDMEFADGGIVGYADGGAAQDMSPEAVNERYRQAQLQRIRDLFGITGVTRGSQSGMTAAEKVGARVAPPVSNVYPSETLRGAATTPVAAEAPPVEAPTGQRTPPVAGQGISELLAPRAPRAAAPTTAGDFMSQYDAARKGRKVDDPFAQQEADLRDKEAAAANLKIEAFDKDMAERGDFRAGQKERLSKREAELGKERSTLKGLAFLEAGLATMQSTGRGLSGIAQGAGVGVKAYTSGLEKLKTAQEKLDDARDKIAEAQDTENQLTKKERRGLMSDAANTVNQGLRAKLAGDRLLLTQDQSLTKDAVASDIAARGRQAQIASAERIAGMQANRSVMADERADARARLDAAKAMMREAGDMLSGPNAALLDDKTKKTYLDDYNAAKTTLQKLGGLTAAPAAATSDKPRPALGSFKG